MLSLSPSLPSAKPRKTPVVPMGSSSVASIAALIPGLNIGGNVKAKTPAAAPAPAPAPPVTGQSPGKAALPGKGGAAVKTAAPPSNAPPGKTDKKTQGSVTKADGKAAVRAVCPFSGSTFCLVICTEE